MNITTTPPKKIGLGRGLSALMEERPVSLTPNASNGPSTNPRADDNRVNHLLIQQLKAGRYQPRHDFNEVNLQELILSIREKGVLQPLIVRPLDGEFYEIIAGERRWRAAQRAGLETVPCLIKSLTDEEALEVALVENLQRENLNPIDEALGYQRLMKEFNHTQEELAHLVYKSRSHISNLLRLLSLPEKVQTLLRRDSLSLGHAKVLATVKDPETLAQQIMNKGLSVRETEAYSKTPQFEDVARQQVRTKLAKEPDILHLEHTLSQALGLPVSIQAKDLSRGGTLSLKFKTPQELDALLSRMKQEA